uniref:Uncharacterized protein K02A2.6-like n=1 Tax=Nicotiana sylvestris TaxID=4096 RepID=A0A1U7XYS4_NICSY|nr:PREDICTED: uncharacterized protein K02A2.6-like [Nicotiana sylvestris]
MADKFFIAGAKKTEARVKDIFAVRQMTGEGLRDFLTRFIRGYLKELLSDKGRDNFARGCDQPQGPLKQPSPAHTIQMIIGGDNDTVINHIKFTTTYELKRTVAHERYARNPKGDCHTQAEYRSTSSAQQIRRMFNASINEAVSEEVDKSLANGSARESKYLQWVANVVMVKKKNGKWRMCVDFTDLNKACPKDSFALLHIDQLINATAGHELLSFLDAYSSYNQFLMVEEDQEKTIFITHRGTYCYKVMPFGLKNTGATYQRLVTKMFKEQLGKTMEAYIDDMLVKSTKKEDHISHLKEAFEILRKYRMKLNPEKCAFEILPEVEQEALHTSTHTDLWVLYTDGASNASGSGLALILKVFTGEVIRQSI